MLPVIDLHQDILLHIKERDLFDNKWQTNFSFNSKANIRTVIATAFPYPPEGDFFHHSVNDLIEDYIDKYNEIINKENSDWRVVLNGEDLEESVLGSGKKGVIISIEGLNKFEGTSKNWEMLEHWYQKGLRSIGALWNVSNKLGGGTDNPELGLTSLGSDVITWAENKGILIDLAHMNRKTFWDSVQKLTKPIVVSHANADVVCSSDRNCDDDQLKAVAESGGVVGVFFAVKFLDENKDDSSIDSIVDHIKYIKKIVGVDHIALGTDFGGLTNGTPKGMSSVDNLLDLFDLLRKVGFSEKETEAIAYGNALRVLKNNLD